VPAFSDRVSVCATRVEQGGQRRMTPAASDDAGKSTGSGVGQLQAAQRVTAATPRIERTAIVTVPGRHHHERQNSVA